MHNLAKKKFYFFGDETEKATLKLLRKINPQKSKRYQLTTEPLDVLVEMIKDQGFDSIGGVPQVYKLYNFSSNLPFNIYWPSKTNGDIYFCGRKLLPYEKNKYLAIDLDNGLITKPIFTYSKTKQLLRSDLTNILLRLLYDKISKKCFILP